MGSEVRKQALWLSRNRAYRRVALEHMDEFKRVRDEELARLGEPPVDDYTSTPPGPVRMVEED